jgi:ferredoxin
MRSERQTLSVLESALRDPQSEIERGKQKMTYVVTELCVDCKYTDCAAVCPVEAFHELPDRLYINADTCIDCDACVPECPVEAIFPDSAVPEQYAHWTQINIDEAPNYPVISQKIPALHGPSCTGPEE